MTASLTFLYSCINFSLFSWGFPLLMLSVSAAFIYKEREVKASSSRGNQLTEDGNGDIHCWYVSLFFSVTLELFCAYWILFDWFYRLMHGSSYIWGFLVPASILLFVGFYLSAQLSNAVKLTAALQIDQRARNKIIKRRGLQVGLFFKVSRLLVCHFHAVMEVDFPFLAFWRSSHSLLIFIVTQPLWGIYQHVDENRKLQFLLGKINLKFKFLSNCNFPLHLLWI